MAKFPVSSKMIKDNLISISGENYKHIVKVLRHKVGENIEFFDESYKTYQAVIKIISSKELIAEIYEVSHVNNEPKLNINLFQSIPKGNKMDFIIQKSTELGVKSVTPVYTERTVVQNTSKIKRWSKIALESCKQSGRTVPLKIDKPRQFEDIFNDFSDNDLTLLFYENSDYALKEFLEKLERRYKTINIVIGPEGGFSDEEIAYAQHNGINILGLGPRVLRAETAAIASVSVIQFYFGDL